MKIKYRYFEDYEVSQKGVTLTRTVNETDNVRFSWLTNNFSRSEVDRHYAEKGIHKGRIAFGQLGSSLAVGMLSLTAPHTVGRGVPGSYLWSCAVDYRGVIKLGDTIRVEWNITGKTDDPAHEGFGQVQTTYRVLNQDTVPIYDGIITTLVRKQSSPDAILELKAGEAWEFTEFILEPGRIYCLEEYPVGGGGETEGRTITEGDIVSFAGLTGDYNPLYTDAEYAKQTQFGERIAHGMLLFSIANGQRGNDWDRYHRSSTVIPWYLSDKATFLAPVKIGDTVRCRYKILASRISKSKPEMGIITYGMQVINQRDEVAQESSFVVMMATKEGLRKEGVK